MELLLLIEKYAAKRIENLEKKYYIKVQRLVGNNFFLQKSYHENPAAIYWLMI